ncbi:MAG: hypothetical protein U0166_21610 [Acidobacteriota bacterium]
MKTSVTRGIWIAMLALGWAACGWASPTVEKVTRTPEGLLVVRVKATEGSAPRLYFRREGFGDFYFANMSTSGGDGRNGSYLAILPRPMDETKSIELYVASQEFAPGRADAPAPASISLATTSVEPLGDDLREAARTLLIGRTTAAQDDHGVAWFQDGQPEQGGGSQRNGGVGKIVLQPPIIIGNPGDPKEVSPPRP